MKKTHLLSSQKERLREFSAGALGMDSFLEIEGNRRIVLTGCRSVAAYTEEMICLLTAGGKIAFFGTGLQLDCLSADEALVTGCLQRIEFEGK